MFPALAGSALLWAAAAPTAPAAQAVTTPSDDPKATATLALCVGEQPGATDYLYAEGPSYVPSTQTQLTVPNGSSIICRAYPVRPGQYYVTTYKYPKAPCTPDATRGNPDQCFGKVHHIHISHETGVIDTVSNGVPNLNTAPGSRTPVVHDTTSYPTNPNVYGLIYTAPPWGADTVIEEQWVLVQVHQGETVQVAAHTADHRTTDCWSGFDPDPNGNAPVCD
jgi:hypothetical protein